MLLSNPANFGTLSKSNALLGIDEDELPNEDNSAIWHEVPIMDQLFSSHILI
jgi:hypothetical protein